MQRLSSDDYRLLQEKTIREHFIPHWRNSVGMIEGIKGLLKAFENRNRKDGWRDA